MTYRVFLAYFHFPVLNGVKYGLLLYSPMQAREVSYKHSLIEQLIWIQVIYPAGFVQVMENLESHRIYEFHFQAWKVMEFNCRSLEVMEN